MTNDNWKMHAALPLAAIVALWIGATASAEPWARHTIDDSSRGADGVRLADVNGDGLPDIVTGWEEGGVVRVYFNPGPDKATGRWPAVTVGRVRDVEDAVFVDLDGDGAIDVVSSCEGKTRTMYVHWAPPDADRYLDETAWVTEPIPATAGEQMWMYCLPMQVDGERGIDLVVGSKGDGAAVGWLRSPANPRELDKWAYHRMTDAGWTMTLEPAAADGEMPRDVIVTDRKGDAPGVYLLRDTGRAGDARWARHGIGGEGLEVMFAVLHDMDGDGRADVCVAIKPDRIGVCHRPADPTRPWQWKQIDWPDFAGTAKSVAVGDLDGDGRDQIVGSCENAHPPRAGLFVMRRDGAAGAWRAHDISGPEGVKFDRVELIDLDGDGDLDVLTCEETANLGVIWYENPAKQPKR